MATPLPYDEDTGAEICERIANGENLKQICEADDLPCESTVYKWLRLNEGFAQQYAHARKAWADAQIEVIGKIARDDHRPAEHKRIEIDTLKWAMGKLNGKYSDKVKHVGGDDGDNPIAFTGFDVRFV